MNIINPEHCTHHLIMQYFIGVFTYKPLEYSFLDEDADADDDPDLNNGNLYHNIIFETHVILCYC